MTGLPDCMYDYRFEYDKCSSNEESERCYKCGTPITNDEYINYEGLCEMCENEEGEDGKEA